MFELLYFLKATCHIFKELLCSYVYLKSQHHVVRIDYGDDGNWGWSINVHT
jgi:hypothetical protein